ncbi:MAG TPA: M20/M25/M40 family metallo-hydrolase [Gemmatimonadaceae bacterium]|nr:M20/M25/M40 family metallo-hydrolase [Gemmatimonadaceae bacterium]
MTNDVLRLTAELMAIDSTSDQEGELMAHVSLMLESRGWRVTRIPVTPGRMNVFATCVNAPVVTLSTHLDTVPPYIPPRLEGDTLWGRGSCDAKGIAAAMILAAEQLRERERPIALLFVVGEEITHDGAHAANANPGTSRVLIDGEPTEGKLALGTKGAMRVVIRTSGVAAHSAYPELGDSAITKLVALLNELPHLELPRDDLLGATTINVGQISGGVADNVIAPQAEARIMVRLVSDAEEMWKLLESWIAGRATLERGSLVPAIRLGSVPGFETMVAAFATDIPALPRWGKPYLYGPGSIHVAHTSQERITRAELESAVKGYVRLAEAALADLEIGKRVAK